MADIMAFIDDECYELEEKAEKIFDYITGLENKLAEKEKESLKYFNEYRVWKRKCDFLENDQIKILEHNQDKISFAVEQLEKVKQNILSNITFGIESVAIMNSIDNQIKQLKEME